jgi:hypothetical protein
MITIRQESRRQPVPANADLEANAIVAAERGLEQISRAFEAAGWGRIDELKLTFPQISTDIAYVINWRRDY